MLPVPMTVIFIGNSWFQEAALGCDEVTLGVPVPKINMHR
jgi:hypothetical protein